MPSAPTQFAQITSRVRLVPGSEHTQGQNLPEFLLFALPIAIYEQRNASPQKVERIRTSAATMIGSHGDDLQFRGKKAGATAVALVQGLALLARSPGGVTFAGVHACLEDHADCPQQER
ncbi:hypothetical protein [Nocardia tengchongensis]|uniref:hypothetical protein n=1 Tax=Nocardia tengchongensis TaxID=2055889 RepID=UPI00364D4815